MDDSWHGIIQSNQVTGYLGLTDFRDVFGGPPRSVLLRHFSPSMQDSNNRFPIMTRKDDLPCKTDSCQPEFQSTIWCGRKGFHVTKRESNTAHNKVLYKSSFATSTYYGDDHGPQVMKREEKLPSDDTFCKLDHTSTTCFIRKRDEQPSFIPAFDKQSELCTISDGHNSFQVMEREYGSSYVTKSDLNSPTTYSVHNRFPVMKSEVDDIFSEDAVVYRPISGQYPITWSGNSTFQALTKEEGFYDDIFGSAYGDSKVDLRRSRSRSISISISKSESDSTAVSCYEDGFLPNSGYGDEGDQALASFASKLRPLMIPSKHYDSSPPSTISEGHGRNTLWYTDPACPSSPITNLRDSSHANNSYHPYTTNKSRCTASSFCCFTPSETLSQEQSFRLSFKKPPSSEDNSPLSFISLSVPCKVREVEKKVSKVFDCAKAEEKQNFGSEVNAALDEAIAWAKERFMIQDAIVGENENFVSFNDWNGTTGKYSADSKER